MTESSPRPFSSTPPPPNGEHDLRTTAETPVKVFVDTSTCIQWTYRLALIASVSAGDLAVYWSIDVQAELARVVERAATVSAVRATRGLPREARAARIANELQTARANFALQRSILDQHFLLAPEVREDEDMSFGITDPDDRLHIMAASAARARYLLTLDQRHMPHGAVFAGVQCWHPDTFLTLFYHQNPDAYERARQRIDQLPDSVRQHILPR